MSTLERGLIRPRITATNLPFWAGLRERRLRLPRCAQCRAWIYPIASVCYECGVSELPTWEEASGLGTISSWVVYHRAFHPAFQPPYAVIQVDLDEGIRLISNPVNMGLDELRSGIRVRAFYDDVAGDLTLLKFEPAASG